MIVRRWLARRVGRDASDLSARLVPYANRLTAIVIVATAIANVAAHPRILHFIDSTIVREHQNAAGGKRVRRMLNLRMESGQVDHESSCMGRGERATL